MKYKIKIEEGINTTEIVELLRFVFEKQKFEIEEEEIPQNIKKHFKKLNYGK